MKRSKYFRVVKHGEGHRRLHGCRRLVFGTVLATTMAAASMALGQGMPPEARENIHTLFNGHDKLQRELKLTDDGYEAMTQSKDEEIASALQKHVQQMQERLDSGLAARRWDPAFAEYRAYYDDIDFKVEKIEQGVKVVAHGKTPEAAKVARNHAKVINEFVNDGWDAHDRLHPAVLAPAEGKGSTGIRRGMGRQGRGQGRNGCGKGCQHGCGRGGPDQSDTKQQP